MKAAMEKSSAPSRMESGSPTRCGCQVSPNTAALISIVPSQRESTEIVLVGNTLATFAAIAAFRAEEDYTPPDRDLSSCSQSVLCTFLI